MLTADIVVARVVYISIKIPTDLNPNYIPWYNTRRSRGRRIHYIIIIIILCYYYHYCYYLISRWTISRLASHHTIHNDRRTRMRRKSKTSRAADLFYPRKYIDIHHIISYHCTYLYFCLHVYDEYNDIIHISATI